MSKTYQKKVNQEDAYSSPWKKSEAIKIRIWEVIWTLFISWLPKFGYKWYVLWLKIFGCDIASNAFVHPSSKIYAPWLLHLGDKCCLGYKAEVYNLGPVKIGSRTTLAQYSYICNGTHDMTDLKLPLMVGAIQIGDDVFIGARALIMPGVDIASGCVIGAGAVLTKDTESYMIYGGNPAKAIKQRKIRNA